MICFVIIFFAQIIVISYCQARNSAFDRRMDLFNEMKIILIMYHIVTFTAMVDDAEAKFIMGYSCATVVVIGVAVNMIMLFV